MLARPRTRQYPPLRPARGRPRHSPQTHAGTRVAAPPQTREPPRPTEEVCKRASRLTPEEAEHSPTIRPPPATARPTSSPQTQLHKLTTTPPKDQDRRDTGPTMSGGDHSQAGQHSGGQNQFRRHQREQQPDRFNCLNPHIQQCLSHGIRDKLSPLLPAHHETKPGWKIGRADTPEQARNPAPFSQRIIP